MPIALQRWTAVRTVGYRWWVACLVLLHAGTILGAGRAAAQEWYGAGMEQSDGNGSWRFTRVVPDDLIGLGYTRLRVTSGACADPDDQAMVFEAALQPLETGDGSWGGTLEPVGLPALLLWEAAPASADARFLPAPDGVSVMVVLDGVPPGVTFTVCVGA